MKLNRKLVVGLFSLSLLTGAAALPALADVPSLLGVTIPENPNEKFTAANPDDIEQHIDKEVVYPNNVQVNMFDYWIHGRDITDNDSVPDVPGAGNSDPSKWTEAAYLQGINKNHAFLFNTSSSFIASATGEKGGYNGWTQNAKPFYRNSAGLPDEGSAGLVQSKLGDDGFPKLNLTEHEVERSLRNVTPDLLEGGKMPSNVESLAYLFDPSFEQDGKASMTNVQGLFKLDKNSGNYTYDSTKNYAYVDEGSNRFVLYDQPAVYRNSTRGMFFPFNHASEVFAPDASAGKINGMKKRSDNANMNHYFGLTLTSQFMQPYEGYVDHAGTPQPMKFDFHGDDDVLIFIDGVLVADLGGRHDSCGVEINFQNGEIKYYTLNGDGSHNFNNSLVSGLNSTLKDQFEKAGRSTSTFKDDTFGDRTAHELKMFYLERGNHDSTLRLSFNLIEPQYSEIIKVDQDGEPLSGTNGEPIEFMVYETDEDFIVDDQATLVSPKPIQIKDGKADLTYTDEYGLEQPLQLYSGKYYVMRETSTLAGYITTGDIHFTYDHERNVLDVKNTFETGAADGFKAQVIQAGQITPYSPNGSGDPIPTEIAKQGLILTVPMLNIEGKKGEAATTGWRPMYGSPLNGFQIVDMEKGGDQSYKEYEKAIMAATLLQILDPEAEEWYLRYNDEKDRFEGEMSSLPGTLDRYTSVNPDTGDIRMTYYLMDASAGLFDADATYEEKIESIQQKLRGSSKEETKANIKKFVKNNYDKMTLLDLDHFNRLFYSQLLVPNQARDLWVTKKDAKGNNIPGAEFTLYNEKECKTPLATGVTNEQGVVSFSAKNGGNNVVANPDGGLSSEVFFPMASQKPGQNNPDGGPRSYWLKETKAPKGFTANPNVVEVHVTVDAMYINAGEEGVDDKISVIKGPGTLDQTMHSFASDGELDITLRDITAKAYKHDGSTAGKDLADFDITSGAWEEIPDSALNLHYQLPGALVDYGIHEDKVPYWETEDGWIGFDVRQNYKAHTEDPNDPYYVSPERLESLKQDLGNTDITALLTGSNTVVVGDERELSSLTVSKKVDGPAADTTQKFAFEVKLERWAGEQNLDFPTSFSYEGISTVDGVKAPKDGKITIDPATGIATEQIKLKHGQGIVIEGIPTFSTFTVTEVDANTDGYTTTPENGVVTGEVQPGSTSKAEFVNYRDLDNAITVLKTVGGTDGDKDRDFTFNLTLTDPKGLPVNDEVAYVGLSHVEGVKAPADGTLTFVDGKASMKLKHGQGFSITNLPIGTSFAVEELEANADGYTTTIAGTTEGTLEMLTKAKVEFLNTKGIVPPWEPEDPEDPKDPENPSNPDDPDELLPGTDDSTWIVGAVGTAGVAALSAAAIARRKRNDA